MATILDYESIEIYLGDRLRRSDNLDIHADHFFPVSILDLLFHFSEKSHGTETDGRGHALHRNFHGHDFDRWIDNLVAHTRLYISDDAGNNEEITLVDIDAMTFDSNLGIVTVTLPDETNYTLMTPGYRSPLQARSIDDLDIAVDIKGMFDKPPVDNDSDPYMGFGAIAHIVRVVCDKSGIDPAKVDAHMLSQRIFDHFRYEMLPLIPSLWNDMDHIMHYATPGITAR